MPIYAFLMHERFTQYKGWNVLSKQFIFSQVNFNVFSLIQAKINNKHAKHLNAVNKSRDFIQLYIVVSEYHQLEK